MTNYNNMFSDIFTTGGFSDFFNELLGSEKTDACKCECNKSCKHCNEDKENKEFDMKMRFTVADKNRVLNYTDEDFKDDEKLNDFLNVTDSIIEEYDKLPSYVQSLINLTVGYDVSEKLTQLQDSAVAVNMAENRRLRQEAKEAALKDIAEENKVKQSNTRTRDLAEEYVDTVVAAGYDKSDNPISIKLRDDIVGAYEDFANWILKQ